MPERESLVALLRERAAAHGDRPAVGFSADPADPAAYEETTYGELDETARRIAVLLRSAGVAEGDRVLLLHPPGLGFPGGSPAVSTPGPSLCPRRCPTATGVSGSGWRASPGTPG